MVWPTSCDGVAIGQGMVGRNCGQVNRSTAEEAPPNLARDRPPPHEEIVHELMYRRTLRNQFFPGAVIDITELKRLISGTGKMTLEELEKATDNNLEDIIERLMERDPRFKYQIIFDGDLGSPKSQHPVP